MAENQVVKDIAIRLSMQQNNFQQAVQNINRQMKVVQSEFKSAAERIAGFGDSTDHLKLKAQSLGQQIDLQKQKLSIYQKQLESARQTLEKNTAEHQKLAQELEQAKEKLEQTRRTYGSTASETKELQKHVEELERAFRDKSKVLDNSIRAFQNYQIKVNQTDGQLAKMERELRQTESAMREAGRAADTASRQLDGMEQSGRDLKSVFENLDFGALSGAVSGAAIMDEIHTINQSTAKLASQLGSTKEQAKELAKVAQDVYRHGFGEGLEEATEGVRLINSAFHVTGDQAKELTKDAFGLRDAFDFELRESIDAARAAANSFGMDAKGAFDLITAGAQNGLNISDDWLDTVREFSPSFKRIGADAGNMLAILKEGLDLGIRDTDRMADSVNEFGIRVQEIGNPAVLALAKNVTHSTKEAQKLASTWQHDFSKGGESAKRVTKAIIDNLYSIEDANKRNALGVQLFGSLWEDTSGQVGLALKRALDQTIEYSGATKELGTQYDTTSKKMSTFGREVKTSIIGPLGDAGSVLNNVIEGAGNLGVALLGLKGLGIGNLIGKFGKEAEGAAKGVSILTRGAGLAAGAISLLTNPIGLVVGGLGLAAGATALYVSHQRKLEEESERLQQVSFKTADSLIKQHDANEKLIDEFDRLRNKSSLTTEEFARYLDLQDQLKETSDPEVIKNIKDQMEQLRKKSGLSNDQLQRMVDLNDKLTEKLPGATSAISDMGNKVAGTTDELKKMNDEFSKSADMELTRQYENAYSNMLKAIEKRKDLEKEIEDDVKNERDLLKIVENYNKEAVKDEIKKHEKKMEQLNLQMLQNGNDEKRNKELLKQYEHEKKIVEALKGGKNEVLKQVNALDAAIEKNKEQLAQENKIIKKYDEARKKRELHLLTEAGISKKLAEQNIRKGTEIDLIDLTIAKLKSEKKRIEENTPANQKNTKEYKNQIDKLNDQISKLKTARSTIVDMKEDAEKYTKALGKDVTKNVDLKFDIDWGEIPPMARRRVLGQVNAWRLQGYAKGTDNAPPGWAWVGEEGPELMWVPGGSKIIPHDLSLKIAKMWQLPQLAVGGDVVRSGLALVGERGRELMKLPAAGTAPLSIGGADIRQIIIRQDQQIAMMQKQVDVLTQILAKDPNLYIDGKLIYSVNKKYEKQETNIRNVFKGVTAL